MELAVCVPLIASVTLLAVDLSNKIYDQEGLQIAAYEAARAVSRPGVSRDRAIQVATQILKSRNLTSVDIDVVPASFAALKPGDTIQVSVVRRSNATKTPADYLLTAPLSAQTRFVRQ